MWGRAEPRASPIQTPRLPVVQVWINLLWFLSLQAWNLRLMTSNKAINMSVKAYCRGVFWQDKITVKQVPFTTYTQTKQESDQKGKWGYLRSTESLGICHKMSSSACGCTRAKSCARHRKTCTDMSAWYEHDGSVISVAACISLLNRPDLSIFKRLVLLRMWGPTAQDGWEARNKKSPTLDFSQIGLGLGFRLGCTNI